LLLNGKLKASWRCIHVYHKDVPVTIIVKLSRVLGRTIAGLLLFASMLYLLSWTINYQDAAPSAAAQRMQALQQAPANITADNNGYIFLRQHTAVQPQQASEAFRQLLQQCKQADCATALADAAPQLPVFVAEHQALLAFYLRLRSYSHWYEPPLTDVSSDTLAYRGLLDAQQLFLLQAWLSAQQQDMHKVREILQQDLQFWRAVLPKNNSLLSKMITVAAIKQHFSFALVIQRQLEPQLQAGMIPALWQQPFSIDELSILQVAAGEWAYGRVLTEQVFGSGSAAKLPWAEQIGLRLLRPLYQPQATRNDSAEWLLSAANGSSVTMPPWYRWFYNPLGKVLSYSSNNDFLAGYHQQILALEPLRQQAVAMPPQNLAAD
jgi:hypothetical protein